MRVSEAVASRTSIRAFLDTPVETELVRTLLEKSARAATGGNLQPWRVFVINGPAMPRFLDFMDSQPHQKMPGYEVYPSPLIEPYRSSRFKVGEDMYELLGIPRDDKTARIGHLMRNFKFFDAPAAFFLFVDKTMGPPQWSDLGMFLQNFMLLAKEAGLDTCAQEAWSNRSESVAKFVKAEDNLMLFCGMAIGVRDKEAPVNQLVSEREPLDSWSKFIE